MGRGLFIDVYLIYLKPIQLLHTSTFTLTEFQCINQYNNQFNFKHGVLLGKKTIEVWIKMLHFWLHYHSIRVIYRDLFYAA